MWYNGHEGLHNCAAGNRAGAAAISRIHRGAGKRLHPPGQDVYKRQGKLPFPVEGLLQAGEHLVKGMAQGMNFIAFMAGQADPARQVAAAVDRLGSLQDFLHRTEGAAGNRIAAGQGQQDKQGQGHQGKGDDGTEDALPGAERTNAADPHAGGADVYKRQV